MKCFLCTMCDANQGLRLKKACTCSADTFCDPLDGFYCTNRKKGSCTFAVKHSKCNPGQYIKHAGTGYTDTVCADCIVGTYSNGSLTTCQPHSKCETEGLKEIKPGTMSADAECGKSTPVYLIVGIVGPLVAAIGIPLAYRKFKTPQPRVSSKKLKGDKDLEISNAALLEALAARFDVQDGKLSNTESKINENGLLIVNLLKAVEFSAAENLVTRTSELERYKRRWNL
ncbi:tumor necrosis factor receptor superfamily member 14-like [Myxocyprinus asiaticus]|uniref:tumor necrosis factor receptor superfamily member 14-like n=1 Tax=Myxocyprinus asiaticus TaxID=70543 RepID=UPI002221F581|nr:tumor necrosis factor receptor superfamily member 14-like [Myxocyprinus asiaticus]